MSPRRGHSASNVNKDISTPRLCMPSAGSSGNSAGALAAPAACGPPSFNPPVSLLCKWFPMPLEPSLLV